MVPRSGRFEELVPRWLFAVRAPALQAVAAVIVPGLVALPMLLWSDGAASLRFAPLLLVALIVVAGGAGSRAAALTGALVLAIYWYGGAADGNSFGVDHGRSAVAVAAMAALCSAVPVLTRQIEKVVDDVRALDLERQEALAGEALARRDAEHDRAQLEAVVRWSALLSQGGTSERVSELALQEIDLPAPPSTASIALLEGTFLRVLSSRGATRGLIRALEKVDVSQSSWLTDVLAGDAVFVNDRSEFARQHPDAGVLRLYPSGSWAVIPFRAESTIGLLSVHHLTPVPLDEYRRYFSLIAEILATALERARAEETQRTQLAALERTLAERDRVARTLATSLLPPTLPALPGFDVAAWLIPAGGGEVAGDFYDLIPVGAGDWVAVLGDVCGKGAEAAAVAALARYAARVTALHDPDPAHIADVVNDALVQDQSDLFCTMSIVRYSQRQESLFVTLAGHHRVRRISGGAVEHVGEFAPALGYAVEPAHAQVVPFEPGDIVALYSDGLVERDASFGDAELDEVLAQGGPASGLAGMVKRAVSAVPPRRLDDCALLVISRDEQSGGTVSS